MEHKNQKLETGEWCIITTNTAGAVVGKILMQGELVTQGGVQKVYKVGIVGNKYIDLFEDEISTIEPLLSGIDKEVFLREIEEKYDIKCFIVEGDLLKDSIIVGNVIHNNVWGNLTDEEKDKFIKVMCFKSDDIKELLNVICMTKQELSERRNSRLEVLDSALEFMKMYNEIGNMFPSLKPVYETLYKDMGFENVINTISK